MKIVCKKYNLLKGLNIVSKAVPAKTTMSILQCILVDCTKGNIRLITIGVAALKVILNRDCRRMWRLYKKHSGKQSG